MSLDNRKAKQTVLNQATDFLIGELLLKAGLIKQSQLDEALKLAGNKHMQIGQMLIMARHITPRDLQAALDAQSAIRDRVMEMNMATRALGLACHQNISFAEACQKQSQANLAAAGPTNKLGELLISANLISTQQFAHAMQRSMATGLPLGRMLVLSGVLNEGLLSLTLETQIQLRDGTISREDAVAHLHEASGAKTINPSGLAQLEGAASHTKLLLPRKHGLRLGEFLVLAGILSEMDVMNALEFSLVSEKPLGKVLIEHGYITEDLCVAALKLQSMIDSGNLDCEQAALSLKGVHNGNMGLLEAMEKVTSATVEGTYIDFQNLITESQLLNVDEIRAAMELAVSNPRLMTKILLMTGYLDEIRAEVILTCYDALVKNKISWQDAINMIAYTSQCLNEGPVTIDELLQRLNLTKTGDDNNPGLVPNPREYEQAGNTTKSIPSMAPKPVPSPIPKPANRHTGKTTSSIPALNLMQGENNLLKPTGAPVTSQPLPRPNQVARTGKTTTNVPALNPLLAHTDLLRPNAQPAGADQSGLARNPKQSFSLKSLLTSQDLPAIATTPGKETDANNEQLKLSEQEKKLIQAATSLNAKPEDIMAAMHLAIQKEKSLEPKPENKE